MTEEEMEEARRRGEEYKRTVDCVVDTISVKDGRSDGANYNSGNNTIRVNYWKERGYGQTDNGTLAHEQKHRDNQMQGMYAYPVSAEQAYKLNMHNEISAMMCDLIVKRQEYLETGDISVFNSSFFGFYKEAIEKGEIHPNSDDPAEFEKEMRLIVNGTQKMWQERWAVTDMYVDASVSHAVCYGDHEGKYAAYWDENYQNAMKIAYNIGGVDFTKYMDKDEEIPEQGLARMPEDLAAYSGRIEAYDPDGPHTYEIFDENAEDGIRTFTADNAEEYYTQVLNNNPRANAFMRGLPQYEGNMSMEQYHKYLQHYLTVQEFQKEAKFGDLQKLAQEKGCSIEEVYQEKYNEAFNKVQEEYGDLIDVATDKAAIDWDKRKELNGGWWNPIPSEEHGQGWYDSAIKKLYDSPEMSTVERCDEELMRPLPKYAQSVNDKANGEEPGWWDKLCNKVKSWGVETEIHDLESKENIKVGFWEGLKNKVAGWFKSDDKSVEEANEFVDNEITHEINTNKPEYPEWKDEDGHRVSDVQHRTIPDLTKPIIKQPKQHEVADKQNLSMRMQQDETKAKNSMNKTGIYAQNASMLKATLQRDAQNAEAYLAQILEAMLHGNVESVIENVAEQVTEVIKRGLQKDNSYS